MQTRQKVLKEAGLGLDLFTDPDNRISLVARGRLVSHCVARTGCRHFGLLLGQHAGLHSFGLVGLLVKYSPDVGTALRSLVRHYHLHARGAAPALAVDGDRAMLSFGIYQPHVEAAEQIGGHASSASRRAAELTSPSSVIIHPRVRDVLRGLSLS